MSDNEVTQEQMGEALRKMAFGYELENSVVEAVKSEDGKSRKKKVVTKTQVGPNKDALKILLEDRIGGPQDWM